MFTAVFVFPTYGLFFLRDMVGLDNPAQALGNMILPMGGALALSVYPAGWLSDKAGGSGGRSWGRRRHHRHAVGGQHP